MLSVTTGVLLGLFVLQAQGPECDVALTEQFLLAADGVASTHDDGSPKGQCAAAGGDGRLCVNHIETLESSLLPTPDADRWVSTFFTDFVTRVPARLGKDSGYPEWVPGECFISCAAPPFFFHGVYNAGDCANFNGIIASILCPDLAVEAQRLFPAIIDRFGYMPGVMNPKHYSNVPFALDYSSTTWGPCGYWDQFAWTRNRAFLKPFSNACATWARWWLANRDRNQDGWIEPGVNDCVPAPPAFREDMARRNPQIAARRPDFWDYVGTHNSNASAMQLMIYEIPWDDGPVYVRGRSRDLRFDPETKSCTIHYIESQLYISMLCRFAADAHRLLGHDGDAAFFEEHAARLQALVNEYCWDENTGFYYDRDIETGVLNTDVKHLGAFVCMLMGLPSMDQARRMVAHLTNPDEFWTAYPAPTISRDSADYDPTHYWSGRAWPPTNFFVLRGLLNYGFFDEADEFLRRWLLHTQTCFDRETTIVAEGNDFSFNGDARQVRVPGMTWIFPENWHPDTGEVLGSGGLTWGGLWLPAVVMRHFWPVGEHHVLLRPGGRFRFAWGTRWRVEIDDSTAVLNGRRFDLPDRTTYLVDELTGECLPLSPGKADPVVLAFASQVRAVK